MPGIETPVIGNSCDTRLVEKHYVILVFMELIKAIVVDLKELAVIPGDTTSKAN